MSPAEDVYLFYKHYSMLLYAGHLSKHITNVKSFILIPTLCSRHYYHLDYTDEEIEAQRFEVTCPRSQLENDRAII